MGVDFFPCNYCKESICDCGDYIRCDCGYKWCEIHCAIKEGYQIDEDGKSCSYCRKENVEDNLLLDFLMKRHNLSRIEVIKDYYDSFREEDNENDLGHTQ